MRHLMFAMALLCLFLNPGCAKFEDESSPGKINRELAAGQKINASNLAENLRTEVQPTTKPERYMVFFSWPNMSDPHRVRIRMEQNLTVVDAQQTTFSHEVNHNQTLTYNFDILGDDSRIEKSFSKLVKVPRDFVVREGQNQFLENAKLNVNRFFISNTPLKTNGFNVEIQTNELISDKGLIETFDENVKAAPDNEGRSGGSLLINAQYASGSLKIYLRGEHGGDGTKGPAYPNRASDGVGAGSGSYTCDCVGRHCAMSLSSKVTFVGSIKPQGLACSCDRFGSNAGNGSNGAKGNKGLPARNGGDSGNLKVTIKDGAGFDLQAFRSIGLAGASGEGGEGQPGGFGGPGRSGGSRDCRGNPGANGAPGPKGDPGDPGVDGKPGTICVYIASEGKNDCY